MLPIPHDPIADQNNYMVLQSIVLRYECFPKNRFGDTLCFLIILDHIIYVTQRANMVMYILRYKDFNHVHSPPTVVR